MGVRKIKYIIISSIIIFISCSKQQNSEEQDRLLKECQEIQKERDDAVHNAFGQLEKINNIYEQLDKINSEMGYMYIEMSNNEVFTPTSKMDKINNHIANLKKEIDKLENDNKTLKSYNIELIKTVSNLRKSVKSKEVEIVRLKEDIKKKNVLIKEQEVEISRKNVEIEKQTTTIIQQDQKIQDLQITKWREMGTELYLIYDEYHNISKNIFKGKDNEKKMKANKRNVLEKAKKCYQEAVSLGSLRDQKQIQQIDNELNSLK